MWGGKWDSKPIIPNLKPAIQKHLQVFLSDLYDEKYLKSMYQALILTHLALTAFTVFTALVPLDGFFTFTATTALLCFLL